MKGISFLMLCFAVVGFTAMGGCSSATPNSQNSTAKVEGHDHDGHDHDGHDHDHAGHEHDGDEHAHGHDATGPHGGHLIELGSDEYHAELVHDEEADQVVVFLLDGSAKHRVPSRVDELVLNLVVDGQSAQYRLAAFPLESETPSRCSRFSVTDASLTECLDHDAQVRGRLNVVIAGKAFVGTIDHHAHNGPHNHHHDDDAVRAASRTGVRR